MNISLYKNWSRKLIDSSTESFFSSFGMSPKAKSRLLLAEIGRFVSELAKLIMVKNSSWEENECD